MPAESCHELSRLYLTLFKVKYRGQTLARPSAMAELPSTRASQYRACHVEATRTTHMLISRRTNSLATSGSLIRKLHFNGSATILGIVVLEHCIHRSLVCIGDEDAH